MVEAHLAQALTDGNRDSHHSRRRREQQLSGPSPEAPPPQHRHRDRSQGCRLPLSARHQQVDQDGTPHVLAHLDELAWAPAHHPRGHSESHCQHHNRVGSPHQGRARPRQLPEGRENIFDRLSISVPFSMETGTTRCFQLSLREQVIFDPILRKRLPLWKPYRKQIDSKTIRNFIVP